VPPNPSPSNGRRVDCWLKRISLCTPGHTKQKSLNFKLAGNEVYCMNALLLLIKAISCDKIQYQIETLFMQNRGVAAWYELLSGATVASM
jgi:hypothetical protein